MFYVSGEGAVKLQPMPLPQGMTPSSTEIIASLNEHLIHVLQVRKSDVARTLRYGEMLSLC